MPKTKAGTGGFPVGRWLTVSGHQRVKGIKVRVKGNKVLVDAKVLDRPSRTNTKSRRPAKLKSWAHVGRAKNIPGYKDAEGKFHPITAPKGWKYEGLREKKTSRFIATKKTGGAKKKRKNAKAKGRKTKGPKPGSKAWVAKMARARKNPKDSGVRYSVFIRGHLSSEHRSRKAATQEVVRLRREGYKEVTIQRRQYTR